MDETAQGGLSLELARTRKEAENIWREVFPGTEPAAYLFREEAQENITVFGAVRVEGALAGAASAVLSPEGLLCIHNVFLRKKFRSFDRLSRMLFLLVSLAQKLGTVKRCSWSYLLTPDRADPYERLLLRLPDFYLEDKCILTRHLVDTGRFDYLRQFHWYTPWLLEKKGLAALPWKACDQRRKMEIARREHCREPDYVSPFLPEGCRYDEASSYALVKGDDPEILGWIICEKITDEEVRLRRFYIYKEARRYRVGPAFSTYVLDVIASRYRYMSFEVRKGNTQMERVAERQFGPVELGKVCICSTIVIKT